ncbi:MAG: transcription antitermination factor NusB [Chitinophagaceae bacterium]
MQLLYIMDAYGTEKGITNPVNELQKQLDKTTELFFFLVYYLTETARYVETDALVRGNKHLPSEDDLNVNTKLAGNTLLWQILEMPGYDKLKEDFLPQQKLDKDLLKKTYLQLVATNEYQEYIAVQSREAAQEKQILQFIFTNLLLLNDDFNSYIEELFANWDDDCELMVQLVHALLQGPKKFQLSQMLTDEKWQFAKSLLITTYNKKTHLQELISPKLNNWDAERIATIDLIILQMGIAEFLYFETIPARVTINEYIDIAKDYSTAQSGQFVNGVLDNIHKELVQNNQLQKIAYKSKTAKGEV